MSAPQPKQSKFEGARRPWNIATEAKPDRVRLGGEIINQAEIQQCLTCTKPVEQCFGECYQKNPEYAKPPPPPPADFRARYESGEHVKALQRRYGVSNRTIYAWIDRLGLPRRSATWKRVKKDRR